MLGWPRTTHRNLSNEELDDANGTALPDREAMSIVSLPGPDLLPLPAEPAGAEERGRPADPSN